MLISEPPNLLQSKASGVPNALHSMKEAKPQSQHAVWFHLYVILKKESL